MDVQILLNHYQESQDAFWQSWNFLCRSYLLLRKVNPLLGDGIAVLGSVVGLLAALEVFTLVSKIFSDKYISALCNFQKGICKILRWVLRQIRNILNSLLVLWRFLRRKARRESEVVRVESQALNKKQLAIETRTLLLKVLATDARKLKTMRQLLCSADANLSALDREDCALLTKKAMTETKGTAVKQYVQSILEISNF